jgi:hypothetical protein
VSDRLLRLPFYNDLREADQACVLEALMKFEPASSRATFLPFTECKRSG